MPVPERQLTSAQDFRANTSIASVESTLARSRQRSLEALTDAILTQEAAATGMSRADLSDHARSVLLGYRWPGNIRQLKNALRSALALCDGGLIEIEHLPEEISGFVGRVFPPRKLVSTASPPGSSTTQDGPHGQHRTALMQALQQHNWNISDAARSLNLNRSTVYRRMAAHNIVQPNKR